MADNQTNDIVEFQNVQSDSENDGQQITGGKSSLPDTSALPPAYNSNLPNQSDQEHVDAPSSGILKMEDNNSVSVAGAANSSASEPESIRVVIHFHDEHYMKNEQKERKKKKTEEDIDLSLTGKEIWEKFVRIDVDNWNEDKKSKYALYFAHKSAADKGEERIPFSFKKTLSNFRIQDLADLPSKEDIFSRQKLELHYPELVPVTIKFKDDLEYMEKTRKANTVKKVGTEDVAIDKHVDIDVRMTGQEIWEEHLRIKEVDYNAKIWTRKKKYNPTLYFEDEDGGKKVFCKKRIIFPLCKTLSHFEDILRSNLRGDAIKKKGLTLHYVEVVPDTGFGQSMQCTCIICGNKEPLELTRSEWDHSYLNPHALERFFDAPIDNNLCTECGYFANLHINTDKRSEYQTQSQPYLLVTGIFLSPAFWVSISLPLNYPELMLISIVAMIVATVIGILLLLFGYGKLAKDKHSTATSEDRENLKKIHEWFKDPYNLVPNDYMKWMFGVMFILNCFNVFELYKLYIKDDINAAFECTFQDGLVYGFDEQCVVYFELMGASTSVLLSMLFINTAVCRRPLDRKEPKQSQSEKTADLEASEEEEKKEQNDKPIFEDVHSKSRSHSIIAGMNSAKELMKGLTVASAGVIRRNYGPTQAKSLRRLQDLAEDSGDQGVKVYFKFAIDVIMEVRESEAPAFMPNGYFEMQICGKTVYPPTRKWWGVLALNAVFVFGLTLVSLITHPTLFWNTLKDTPGYFALLAICYFCVARFLFLHCTVMRRVTLMLRKAHALMKISANPLNFIYDRIDFEKEEMDYEEEENAPKDKENDESKQDDAQGVGNLNAQEFLNMSLADVLNLQMNGIPPKKEVDPEPTEPKENDALQYYLNPRMRIVTPEFLRAWWALRNHIQQWELRYFYELTQPIISLETVFVLSMILMAIIGVFQEEYDGDIRLFLVNMVAESNVVMTFVLFLVLVCVQLLVHLLALLKPFQEQKAHEAWVEKMSLCLEIEEANMYTCVAKKERQENSDYKDQALAIKNTRSLLKSLKTEMAENRASPKLLGILPLNEALIQTIIGTITTSMTVFASSFATGILTDISEASGFTPTAEPTMSPTYDPTGLFTTD